MSRMFVVEDLVYTECVLLAYKPLGQYDFSKRLPAGAPLAKNKIIIKNTFRTLFSVFSSRKSRGFVLLLCLI